MKNGQIMIADDVLINRIYQIRGKKVMVDRNLKRFPEDFMFQMSVGENEDWMSQIVMSNREKMGLRKPPLVFTEQGVTMLSCVLNSDRRL